MRWSDAVMSVVCVACATACGGAAPRSAAPPGRTTTLFEALQRDVGDGSSVAIVNDRKLVAISSDGARERVLSDDGAAWIGVDRRERVIWIADFDPLVISAIDLDAPDSQRPAIVEIATAMTSARSISINGIGNGGLPAVTLSISDSPELAVSPCGSQADCAADPSVQTDVETTGKVVDVAFVKRIAARRDTTPSRARDRGPPAAFAIDGFTCDADTGPVCGKGVKIDKTRYALVITDLDCSDQCVPRASLYDTEVKALVTADWADGFSTRRRDGPAPSVALDGSAVFSSKGIVRFDGSLVAASQGGGWLDGETIYACDQTGCYRN